VKAAHLVVTGPELVQAVNMWLAARGRIPRDHVLADCTIAPLAHDGDGEVGPTIISGPECPADAAVFRARLVSIDEEVGA